MCGLDGHSQPQASSNVDIWRDWGLLRISSLKTRLQRDAWLTLRDGNAGSLRPQAPVELHVSLHNYTQYVQKMQDINTLNNLEWIYHFTFSGFLENVQFQLTWFLD